MEFVVKHDDGLNGEGLEEADIVLIGVSRTGKTPLSMYLGFSGYKTANVPLVRGIEPPGRLFQIARAKIVSLTIDAERLARSAAAALRASRVGAAATAMPSSTASSRSSTRPNASARRLGCPVSTSPTPRSRRPRSASSSSSSARPS